MVGDVINARDGRSEKSSKNESDAPIVRGKWRARRREEVKEKSTFSQMSYLATTYTIYDMCVYAVCIGYKCVVHIVSGWKYNIRHTNVGNVWCESFFFYRFCKFIHKECDFNVFYTHGIKTAIAPYTTYEQWFHGCGPVYIPSLYRWKYKIYRYIAITTKFHTISHTQYTYMLFTIEIIWLLVVMFILSFVLRFVLLKYINDKTASQNTFKQKW